MKAKAIWLSVAALLAASASPAGASAASQTYHYVVTHSKYGEIGAYDRVVDEANGVTHAVSHLRIAVKILGIVMHREDADQNETWRNGRLVSFQSVTTTNGSPLKVSGEARDNNFVVTTPAGDTLAPLDVAASDPLGFSRTGHAEVVSIKSGKVEPVDVTGGEVDEVMLNGVDEAARHFRVSTATQPNKWEVWLDQRGVPIKFRSIEKGDTVDFTLSNGALASNAGAGG